MTANRTALPSRVQGEVEAQRSALRDRIDTSGLYRHEIDEFDVAVAALARTWPTLRIAEDLGSLTTPESRNVVRRVRLRDGTTAVLKVVGNTREPGEGDVLNAWHMARLPCVRPLAWGYMRVAPEESGLGPVLKAGVVDLV